MNESNGNSELQLDEIQKHFYEQFVDLEKGYLQERSELQRAHKKAILDFYQANPEFTTKGDAENGNP